jgi:hypothetical protein
MLVATIAKVSEICVKGNRFRLAGVKLGFVSTLTT